MLTYTSAGATAATSSMADCSFLRVRHTIFDEMCLALSVSFDACLVTTLEVTTSAQSKTFNSVRHLWTSSEFLGQTKQFSCNFVFRESFDVRRELGRAIQNQVPSRELGISEPNSWHVV